MGFEDRPTFMVTQRNFSGIPLSQSGNDTYAVFTTAFYVVTVIQKPAVPTPAPTTNMCSALSGMDVTDGERISTCRIYSKPCLAGVSQSECCGNCTQIGECSAWIYSPSSKQCWLMASAEGTHPAEDRNCGGNLVPASALTGVSVKITTPSGDLLWSIDDLDNVNQNLNWPAPSQSKAYAIKDYPRFYVPPWAPMPAPPDVDPALAKTSGYDFRNDQSGDTYVFLLGASLEDWHAARKDFIVLAGPTPIIPDFAFGTWFTWWHQYTEAEAKGEVERWNTDKLPIDVWALDMNWREANTGHTARYQPYMDHFYTYPNEELFPSFKDNQTDWFDYLKDKGLRTYFNDHPFPMGGTAMQTSPEEVAFRWQGLTSWAARGLTYWWYDHNWEFSIPPPNTMAASWQGMNNIPWGSHLYFSTIAQYNKLNPDRAHTAPPQRPMSLTKYATADMVPGLVQHQHPAQHRFPVWWTGDGVSLEASVESMVDSGLYDFKPYVHSDCGGDYRSTGNDLIRWTEHCTFGTIFRYHGDAHQPWSFDAHTEDTIRSYLNMRYSFIPGLIAGSHTAALTGFPLVARCDLFWPEHAEARDNHQYLFLNDTLVAPIWDSKQNVTRRTVWIPPGQWQDAWDGSMVTGPQTISTSQPYERIPLWHRKGGLVITAPPALRVDQQDWSQLVLHAFPEATAGPYTTQRTVYPQNDHTDAGKNTLVSMTTGVEDDVTFSIEPQKFAVSRSWLLRVQLEVGSQVESLTVDGVPALHLLTHVTPRDSLSSDHYMPFGSQGAPPAPFAGSVAEILLPVAVDGMRKVVLRVSKTATAVA